MTLYVFLGILFLTNLAYLVYLDRLNRRNQQQIDSLTNKIIAPQTVTALEASETKLPNGGVTIEQRNVPLSEADPDDVMAAIEIEMGRREP